MNLSRALAEQVLLEEAAAADTKSIDPKWKARFIEFSQMCVDEAKTHIAFLGTALLAKSTDVRADVFSVKARRGKDTPPGAYSARGIVEVLARNARPLG